MLKKSVIVAMVLAAALSVNAKELKVLMIGNSFSICVGKYLSAIVQAEKDSILLCSAYIGGCSLQKHADNLKKAEKDPKFKNYAVDIWQTGKKKETGRDSINNLLKAEKWDIVTIQQASSYSWRFESYVKPGAEVISYIRKYAPQAKIYIQQTWSYRCDDPRLPCWKIDNTQMYNKLKDAYSKFASLHKLPLIPMGDAVQLFRAKTPVKYVPPSAAVRKALNRPKLPSNKGDVVGSRLVWAKGKKSGKDYIRTDASHLNEEGRYMQGLLWYGVLYGKDPSKITYTPHIFAKEAPLLKTCASLAWKNNKNK